MSDEWDYAALRDSIRSRPHWRVVIRPTEHIAERLSIEACWRAVESANVVIRGWDYPHVDVLKNAGQDWVQSWVEFAGERSFWRFHQSGHFIHVFAFREDSFVEKIDDRVNRMVITRDGFVRSGYVDFLNLLYTATEICEFASRLAQSGALGPRMRVEIAMVGIKDRLLVATEVGRVWRDFNPATESNLSFDWEGDVEELIADAAGLARKAARHFYERFGWTSAGEQLLVDEQAMFLSQRRRP